MAEQIECAVIGGGVVGLAIARQLAMNGREVVVLEAEEHWGTHTSSRNSEVMHAGIYYPTGSLKAKLCFAGRNALYRYCAEHDVNHKRIGKVIVACDETELGGLEKYRKQAEINGCDDLRMLGPDELADMEPNVRCVAGFLSPSTGVIDAHGLMLAYIGDLEAHGGAVAVASPVLSGEVTPEGYLLRVGGAEPMELLCKTLINSAGFHAQAVSRGIVGIPQESIPPTHYAIGHYYTLSGPSPFNRLIYPVARQDWLGVHVTIDLGNQVKFGPDFAWIDRIDYEFDDSPEHEQAFYTAIRRYYPGLKDGALHPGYTGIRPKIHGPNEPAPDFMIQGPRDHGLPNLVTLYGIESPGLSSSLAIGEYVSGLLNA